MEVTTRGPRFVRALPWALCGLSLGIAAGFLAGEMLGSDGHRRLGSLFRPVKHPRHAPRALLGAITQVQEALTADPSLEATSIEVRSRGHRGLELRGWVASRNARARAHRVARAASGEYDVANRLLVRGEDDLDVPRPA